MYLSMEMSGHSIWKSIEQWQKILDNVLDTKVTATREVTEERKKKIIKKQIQSIKANSTLFLNKSIFEMDEYEKNLTLLAKLALQQYTPYMISYNVDMKSATELILQYAKKYKLEPITTFELIIEFYTNKKIETDSYISKLKRKYKKLHEVCKNNDINKVLMLSVPYLNKKEMRNLLLLNKTTYEVLKRTIFKQVLIKTYKPLPIQLHLQIWSQLLNLVSI